MNSEIPEDEYQNYQELRISFWNKIWKRYQHIVPVGCSVLEIGCGNGKLLGNLPGKKKVGVDFSAEAINLAKNKYTECEFIEGDSHTIKLDEKFDYIILSDLACDLWDVQIVLATA